MKMYQNKFYGEFDWETPTPATKLDYRTVFQRERDRIIHNSAFRKLQTKTQVFLSGEYDFYRTRLTHSIEVAQIGRSICNYLFQNSPYLNGEYYIDSDLVESICLAHDLGHPPFGHAGEKTLNKLMADFGGFEGNAQTLRLLTEIFYTNPENRQGLNPSRAMMDGVMKYKSLFGELVDPEKHFLYDDQEKYLEFVFDGREYQAQLAPGKVRNGFRSVECQIMDWADDTAYSLNDIVDGIHAGFINEGKLHQWAATQELSDFEQALFDELIGNIRARDFERTLGRKIGTFIRGVELMEQVTFMSGKTNRHRYKLQVDASVQKEAKFYKNISLQLVFLSPQLHQLEYKGDFILSRLFDAFVQNYHSSNKKPFKILADADHQNLRNKPAREKMRLICDQVAGMTDGFVTRTYKRLFDPSFGSIVDLI